MRISSKRDEYLNKVFTLQDPQLLKIKEDLRREELDYMSISAHEGRLLQFLVRGFGVKKIVEVGTLYGYSALCMAKALPADGVVYALEKSETFFEVAQKHFDASTVGEKIKLMLGDARESLTKIEREGPFDLVFIDADKAGYTAYLDWAEKNVRRGGLIIGDNTFLFGHMYGEIPPDSNFGEKQEAVMREFNLRLADPSRYNSILIPTTEGMTVAQKLF